MGKNSVYKNIILNEEETILKTVRRSWLVLITSLILPVILIALPFFFLYPLFNWGDSGIIIFFTFLIAGLFWLTKNLAIWCGQIFILTNQRIIDVDQRGLFQKIVSNIPLTKIQDVFYQIKGIGQTLTRLGNIYITLINTKTKIEIKNIALPQQIQQLILQTKADYLQKKLKTSQFSNQELLNLVKKIKNYLGEEKFGEILKEKGN